MEPSSRLILKTLERMVWIHKFCRLSSSSTPKRIAVFFCSSVGSPSENASLKAKSSILGFLTSSGKRSPWHSV